jgi:hypothetical protein
MHNILPADDLANRGHHELGLVLTASAILRSALARRPRIVSVHEG